MAAKYYDFKANVESLEKKQQDEKIDKIKMHLWDKIDEMKLAIERGDLEYQGSVLTDHDMNLCSLPVLDRHANQMINSIIAENPSLNGFLHYRLLKEHPNSIEYNISYNVGGIFIDDVVEE